MWKGGWKRRGIWGRQERSCRRCKEGAVEKRVRRGATAAVDRERLGIEVVLSGLYRKRML